MVDTALESDECRVETLRVGPRQRARRVDGDDAARAPREQRPERAGRAVPRAAEYPRGAHQYEMIATTGRSRGDAREDCRQLAQRPRMSERRAISGLAPGSGNTRRCGDR